MRILLACILLLAPRLLLGAPIPVVASFSILADLTRQVGGERISLTTLVGPDGDSHVYQPTPKDVSNLAGSKLFIVNGLGFEGWQQRLIEASHYRGKVVTASKGINPIRIQKHDDPHAWHDPLCALIYVANIEAALSDIDPSGTVYYHARADKYREQLRKLNAWAMVQFNDLPATKRRVIASHDALNYLAARYGFSLSAAQGMSTEAEPSPKDIAMLIRQIRKDGTRAIFVENIGNSRLIEQLAQEASAQVGGHLYTDALSPANGPAADYLAMMRYNVTMLVSGMKKN